MHCGWTSTRTRWPARPRCAKCWGRISAGALTRYPEREPAEAIVADYLCLVADMVALTNGVDEAIHVLFDAFLEDGDELLLPVPTYTMYEVYASATDARAVTVQAADDLEFPFERLLAAITPRTKIIAIANPNSPSGSVATRAQLTQIARSAPHAVVFVDEAYFHFHGETIIDLIGALPNLAVARTFSKAYGLAGLRLGVLAGAAELMRWVRRVLSPYSVNSVALACLPPALEDASYVDWFSGQQQGSSGAPAGQEQPGRCQGQRVRQDGDQDRHDEPGQARRPGPALRPGPAPRPRPVRRPRPSATSAQRDGEAQHDERERHRGQGEGPCRKGVG